MAFTVSDLGVSVPWYAGLFGMSQVMEQPHQGGRGVILRHADNGLFIGLHEHDVNAGSRFDETGTGLDHVSFSVPDRAALEEWLQTLRERGIEHSPIAERDYGSVLVFRDPNNIQLELISPPSTPEPE